METLQKICLVLTIIGAINWGLIGILDLNVVSLLFGEKTVVSKVFYLTISKVIKKSSKRRFLFFYNFRITINCKYI